MAPTNSYKQLPKTVPWRWAAVEIARCLGDQELARRFRSSSSRTCAHEEFDAMQRLLASRPGHPPVDRVGHCACDLAIDPNQPVLPLYFGAPPMSSAELGTFDVSKACRAHSPADLGFVENVPGCVYQWLMIVEQYASVLGPSAWKRRRRPGSRGRPSVDLGLRGALLGLHRKVELARREADMPGVVSPATCIALLFFFQVFSIGTQDANPALPKLRPDVETGARLRVFAKRIEDLIRDQPKAAGRG
jgi:hypothetical protein